MCCQLGPVHAERFGQRTQVAICGRRSPQHCCMCALVNMFREFYLDVILQSETVKRFVWTQAKISMISD